MGSRAARPGLKRALGTALCWLLLAASPASASCSPETVELKGPDDRVTRFRVELADTDAKRMKGLMHREKMPVGAGMLFLYDAPSRAVFWMKNTLIPLDMIFADAAGRVLRVRENAIPHDETPIDGGPGISAVLEINGGLARRLGISQGHVLRHPSLSQDQAAWPCN